MESWRKVWRDGLAPLISTEGLEALRAALATTTPGCCKGRRRRRRRCSACRTGRSRPPAPWATAAGRATGWRPWPRSRSSSPGCASRSISASASRPPAAGSSTGSTRRRATRCGGLLLAEVNRTLAQRRASPEAEEAVEGEETAAA